MILTLLKKLFAKCVFIQFTLQIKTNAGFSVSVVKIKIDYHIKEVIGITFVVKTNFFIPILYCIYIKKLFMAFIH